VRDLHQEFQLPESSSNETVRVKQIDKSEIPEPVLTGKWHMSDILGKGPPIVLCPRMCLQQSPPNIKPVYWWCSGECAGQGSTVAGTIDDVYYVEVEPTGPQDNVTTVVTQYGGCDSRCRKYHCCQTEDTCTCSSTQLAAIAAGTLTLGEVLAARDAAIAPDYLEHQSEMADPTDANGI
jgi:hypothetical protein